MITYFFKTKKAFKNITNPNWHALPNSFLLGFNVGNLKMLNLASNFFYNPFCLVLTFFENSAYKYNLMTEFFL